MLALWSLQHLSFIHMIPFTLSMHCPVYNPSFSPHTDQRDWRGQEYKRLKKHTMGNTHQKECFSVGSHECAKQTASIFPIMWLLIFLFNLLCFTLTSNGIEENDIDFRPVSLRELRHIWPVLILTMQPYIFTNMICNFWCQSLLSNHLIFYIFPSHL